MIKEYEVTSETINDKYEFENIFVTSETINDKYEFENIFHTFDKIQRKLNCSILEQMLYKKNNFYVPIYINNYFGNSNSLNKFYDLKRIKTMLYNNFIKYYHDYIKLNIDKEYLKVELEVIDSWAV